MSLELFKLPLKIIKKKEKEKKKRTTPQFSWALKFYFIFSCFFLCFQFLIIFKGNLVKSSEKMHVHVMNGNFLFIL
jgi:hypothetical protein